MGAASRCLTPNLHRKSRKLNLKNKFDKEKNNYELLLFVRKVKTLDSLKSIFI